MPRTRECDFCGEDIEPGTGTMFVAANGATTHFCSSKCEKNADLGREGRDVDWTEEGHAQGGPTIQQPEPETESDAETESESDDADDSDDSETEADSDSDAGAESDDGEATDTDAGAESDDGEAETDDEEAEEAEA